MKKISVIIMLIVLPFLSISAQERGHFIGSFESLDHVYVNDKGVDFKKPDYSFASNNYLKMDYYKGKFSTGIQLQSFTPAIIGYPEELDGFVPSNFYVNFKDNRFSVTAGTFYEQFGSGLLFRSWEDRQLGFNNAIVGGHFAYNYDDKVVIKALWGVPRLGMKFTDTQVRGADLSISISNLAGWDNVMWSIEGSFLNKYEKVDSEYGLEEYGYDPNSYGWSGRMNFDVAGFYIHAEYVDQGMKFVNLQNKRGNAQLLEFGYNNKGLGVTFTTRRLEHMQQQISILSTSQANLLAYVPAMCAQHTYQLLTLNPYSAMLGDDGSVGVTNGELGGQIDAYYNFKRGTKLGGKRGMRIHANYSSYYCLPTEHSAKCGNLLYRDFTFDFEKRWTKNFKSIIQYTLQQYNPSHGYDKTTDMSHTVIADLLYKYTPSISTRMELQYLHSKTAEKDWFAILMELNFAPHWSVWGSDMYNHGLTKKNYYNVGLSYSWNTIRVAVGYGRYRGGKICSGGVCRTSPTYTGANFSLTASF